MSQQSATYKTFRVSVDTKTLLDDFAPVLIEDISRQFQPLFQLKEEYCAGLAQHCKTLQSFPEFSGLVTRLHEQVDALQNDFRDCEENVDYFTLVFMGAVSAGKTSLICDLLNVNPDQMNRALQSSSNFQPGEDDILIAGKVATTHVYEFLVEASRLRLVDIPGTGGVVHDNATIAPFVNKADCILFLSNGHTDLSADDYDFVVRHIVGLRKASELTPENASSKKALIVVNKWKSVVGNLPPAEQRKTWQKKEEWILWGESKKSGAAKFNGLSELFKRTLTIVPATTSQRVLDEKSGAYGRYGEVELGEMLAALKNILLEEGIQIKLERPKLILGHSLTSTRELLVNERTKRSVEELVAKLEQLGVKVSLDSRSIMALLSSRLESLQNRLRRDLFTQIKGGLEQWKPNVSVMDRIKSTWPKEWWGSDQFGARAVQEELKVRWQSELETLLSEGIDLSDIKQTMLAEANSISQLLATTFKAQLAEIQQQTVKDRLARGAALGSFDHDDFDLIGSSQTLEEAVNKAVKQIQHSIVDDIIGIVTVDVVIAALLGSFLSPLGSAAFFAIRRWWSGQAEEKKAKRELEDQIWHIADEVSTNLQEQVADKLRDSVQASVDSITQAIEGERESFSKLLQTLDDAIATVTEMRQRLETISS